MPISISYSDVKYQVFLIGKQKPPFQAVSEFKPPRLVVEQAPFSIFLTFRREVPFCKVGDERRFYLTFFSVPCYTFLMKYKLDKGNHSVYSLQFHYVACVKYRQKVLIGNIADRLKAMNLDVAKAFGITIIEQETAIDHIHILFSSKPQIQTSKFVNSLKSVSARLLFREFPELQNKLRRGHFWSPSYFLATTGQVTLEDLKKYVENQNL